MYNNIKMNNTEKFLELYNDLDSLLRMHYHESSRTVSVMMRYINDLGHSGNPKLSKISKKLNSIRVLRNNIIHDFDNNSDHLFEISDETINFLKFIVDSLKNPKNARDLYTPLTKLYYVRENDELRVLDVMTNMRKYGFSQVPILDKHNVLKGVFSPNCLFAYLANNKDKSVDELTFKDIKEQLPIHAHFSETYTFIAANMNETDIDTLFLDSFEKNKKLVVAFVTQSGNPKEPVLGIIVTRDLLIS